MTIRSKKSKVRGIYTAVVNKSSLDTDGSSGVGTKDIQVDERSVKRSGICVARDERQRNVRE